MVCSTLVLGCEDLGFRNRKGSNSTPGGQCHNSRINRIVFDKQRAIISLLQAQSLGPGYQCIKIETSATMLLLQQCDALNRCRKVQIIIALALRRQDHNIKTLQSKGSSFYSKFLRLVHTFFYDSLLSESGVK